MRNAKSVVALSAVQLDGSGGCCANRLLDEGLVSQAHSMHLQHATSNALHLMQESLSSCSSLSYI